jgi:hypothetical protein
VRVPDEAGDGMAKVRFTFETWKEGNVASSTIEVPVVQPKVGRKVTYH